MKASKLISELQRIITTHGDIECTCTHSLIPEDGDKAFETTVENLTVQTREQSIRAPWWPKLTEEEKKEKRVRFWL